MPSVVGLLEEHELAARRRVDGVREEADRIQAELAADEQEWQEWVIARRRVGTVSAPDGGGLADEKAAPGLRLNEHLKHETAKWSFARPASLGSKGSFRSGSARASVRAFSRLGQNEEPAAPTVKREAEEDWGRDRLRR